MEQLTGNPLFPYFNDYWQSPLALPAPYRDMRFLPTHFWRAAFVSRPVLDRLACRRRSGLSGYPRAARLSRRHRRHRRLARAARRAATRLLDKRVTPPSCSPSPPCPISSGCKFFAIYRYIILLEMLAPTLDRRRPSGLLPLARRTRYLTLAALCFAMPGHRAQRFPGARAAGRSLYPGRRCRPFPIPTSTMVLMTGDAPMGFIATVPAAPDSHSADRRLDGAAPGRHRASPSR